MFPSRNILYEAIFKARKTWPPDFSKLTPKHRFALERRYRRRMKLKLARPKFNRIIKMMQFGGVGFVLWYGVFWADWPQGNVAFGPIRKWMKEAQESIWSVPASRPGNSAGSPQQTPTRQ